MPSTVLTAVRTVGETEAHGSYRIYLSTHSPKTAKKEKVQAGLSVIPKPTGKLPPHTISSTAKKPPCPGKTDTQGGTELEHGSRPRERRQRKTPRSEAGQSAEPEAARERRYGQRALSHPLPLCSSGHKPPAPPFPTCKEHVRTVVSGAKLCPAQDVNTQTSTGPMS